MSIPKRRQTKGKAIAAIFSGLSHPVRAAIFTCLLDSISEVRLISRELSLSEPLVVHHLKIMQSAGWLSRMNLGRTAIYSLKPEILTELKKIIQDTERNL